MPDTPSGLVARLRLAKKAIDAARDLRSAARWHVAGVVGDAELMAEAARCGRKTAAFDKEAGRDD